MPTAAFETSTRSPSVALQVGDELFLERLSGARPHASDLLPALQRLLSRAGLGVGELEGIVVGTGPGSFTGLRVAVATALGLARGTGCALFGLPSGEALCWRELAIGEEAAVVLDARRGAYSFAQYRRTPSGIEVLRAPCVVGPLELASLVHAQLRVFGEPGIESAAALAGVLPARLALDRVPCATAVLELGRLRSAREGPHFAAQLEPLYLRAFGTRPN